MAAPFPDLVIPSLFEALRSDNFGMFSKSCNVSSDPRVCESRDSRRINQSWLQARAM
jgi:hypothetical protein